MELDNSRRFSVKPLSELSKQKPTCVIRLIEHPVTISVNSEWKFSHHDKLRLIMTSVKYRPFYVGLNGFIRKDQNIYLRPKLAIWYVCVCECAYVRACVCVCVTTTTY